MNDYTTIPTTFPIGSIVNVPTSNQEYTVVGYCVKNGVIVNSSITIASNEGVRYIYSASKLTPVVESTTTDDSLDTNTLDEVIERAISRFPNEQARIERAADLLLNGHVMHLHADMFAVRSGTTDTITYIVENAGCPCPDHTQRAVTCKHQWAISLLVVTLQRMRKVA